MSVVLEITDIEAGYQSDLVPVIKKVSFRAERGAVVTLIGKNGSGKSTLLRGLAGDPQVYLRGEVRFQGYLMKRNPHWWRQHSVLWIPQQGGAFEELSVNENLKLSAHWAGAQRIDAALQLFPDLEKLLTRKAMYLSGGERRMLELAIVTFVSLPTALLIDEPTAALSLRNATRFLEYVNTLLDNGTTVVLASHQEELSTRANQIVHIGQKS